jgi:hypothetical protein
MLVGVSASCVLVLQCSLFVGHGGSSCKASLLESEEHRDAPGSVLVP